MSFPEIIVLVVAVLAGILATLVSFKTLRLLFQESLGETLGSPAFHMAVFIIFLLWGISGGAVWLVFG